MPRRRRLRRPSLPDLFTPVPQRPTWDSLPSAVAQQVTELLAELLRGRPAPRPRPAPRKGAAHE
jgi:hypothetical protein